MQKKELVFVPLPATGHMVSILEFADRLLDRDHRLSVTVLLIKIPSGPPITASNPNIRFVELPLIHPPEPQLMKKSLEKAITVFMENHKSVIREAIISQVLSKSTPLAGVVFDMFCTVMVDVANELGVPSYVFFPCAAAFLDLMLYLPVHYSKTGREFAPSDPDLIIPAIANAIPPRFFPSFLFNSDGGYESVKNHATRYKETRGIFINTSAELEPRAIRCLTSYGETPPIYAVGPLVNLGGREESESKREKITKWLDDQPHSSVIFLCFGSMGGFQPPQLAEIAVALERSGQRFLWCVRRPLSKDFSEMPGEFANFSEVLPEGFLERTENRGLVCGWAPQVEVLAHQAVGGFVSHCGWNSILESLWHGVPIATWPIYAEQQMDAFYLVKELGLAVELKMDYRLQDADEVVMADEIEKAIRNLMDAENPVRKKVKEMSDISRKAGMAGRLLCFASVERESPSASLSKEEETSKMSANASGAGNVEELSGLQTYITGPRDPKRAILLLSDAIGYEAPNFRRLADKIAEAGFLVVAPDFFYGDPLDINNPNVDRAAWMKAHNAEKGCEDAKGVIDGLKSKGVSAVGAAGFCWGGMAVVKLAKFDCIQAAVILHPGPITVEEINEVKVPTALLGAEADHLCPAEHLQYLGQLLSAKPEVDSFTKIYPGVKHGWTLMYNADDEAAVKIAEEAHSDMLNWITKYI